MDAAESVHELSLVLVDTLDLNREEGVRVDRQAESALDVFSKPDFVGELDVVELLHECCIVDLGLELAQKHGVGEPLVAAEGRRNQLGQSRVALQAPRGDNCE